MDRVIAAPASRNSPCPCGSGRRYKDCHGLLGSALPHAAFVPSGRSTYRAPGVEWAHLDAATRDECGELMETALREQIAGRFDEAARGYQEVLARAPNTHDALHMLGVIELGRGDLDEAERLIQAALALRPAYATIEHNLRLVDDARLARMRAQPEQLAERALPILSELALGGTDQSSKRPTPERSLSAGLNLIGRAAGTDDDAWLLRRLCAVLGSQVSVWTSEADAPDAVAGARVRAIDVTQRALPQGGTHVYVGLDLECSEWIARANADRVIVIPLGAAPTVCLDQLRAIAHDGARRVELVLLSPSMAARFGHGHHVLTPPIEPVDAVGSADAAAASFGGTAEYPQAWTVGISGQSRHSVAEPTDIAFVRSLAATAGCLHVHDPGRMRFALGADPRVRCFVHDNHGVKAFLSSLRCYVHRVDRWWDEGIGREMFMAMGLGLPVLCPRGSLYADYIDDGVDGALYGSADEALVRLAELRRTPELAAAMGRAARAKAARLFEPSGLAGAWRKLVYGDSQPLRWSSTSTLASAQSLSVAP